MCWHADSGSSGCRRREGGGEGRRQGVRKEGREGRREGGREGEAVRQVRELEGGESGRVALISTA